nr:glutathione S-transferase N-terminal domain-containing protein [Hyphomonas sp. Mor2]
MDWSLSLIASALRLGAGGTGSSVSIPTSPLILYEFESCPFCRIAREQVSASGVTVNVKPCPKGGKRFRPEVKQKGGKAQFPYLVDPNVSAEGAAVAMYESADIARYLRQRYGKTPRPLIHWAGPINQILSQFAALARYMNGTIARPAAQPDKPLLLYASERSAGGRLVKEMLCSKELEYFWTAQAPNGQRTPLLKDPNSDRLVTGSFAILNYLRQAYPRLK